MGINGGLPPAGGRAGGAAPAGEGSGGGGAASAGGGRRSPVPAPAAPSRSMAAWHSAGVPATASSSIHASGTSPDAPTSPAKLAAASAYERRLWGRQPPPPRRPGGRPPAPPRGG